MVFGQLFTQSKWFLRYPKNNNKKNAHKGAFSCMHA